MAYALGGRASEELVFRKISTGALSDLEKITKQAYAMVAFFGMSDKVGNVSFYDSTGQNDFGFTKPYSEKTSEIIDLEVKQIIEESYQRAKMVLKDHMKGLTELAELLLEKEVIFSEDLERIFGKRKADIIKEEHEAEARKNDEKKAETARTAEVNTSEAEIKPEKKTRKKKSNPDIKSTEGSSDLFKSPDDIAS
jgi:cell division protease FtsH